jgi:hypothetical protein
MAAAIAQLVREVEPEWRNGERLEIGLDRLANTPLRGVLEKLTVRREALNTLDRRAPGWTASRAYSTESARMSEVAAAIEAKDGVYDSCREVCDEAWLVVVLAGGADSFQGVDEEILSSSFPSRFDRVLLLCIDVGPGMQRVFELRRVPCD